MPVKDAAIRFSTPHDACARCGHPELLTGARPQGAGCLWFAYCPACRRVHELADIPGWFGRGLPPPARACPLH